MMHQSQNGLERQKHKHNDADDGVVVIKQVHRNVVNQPYANTKCSNVNEVCKDLEKAVDYPDTTGGTEANDDRPNWEEQNEGEGSENAVCNQDFLSLGHKAFEVEAAAVTKGTTAVVAAWATGSVLAARSVLATTRTVLAARAILSCGYFRYTL
jgi:hypothetical protein